MDIYQRKGYADRNDYLNAVADEYGIPLEAVYSIASVLGPNEDFDGLISIIDDFGCVY